MNVRSYSNKPTRTHVLLPGKLLAAVDQLVGQRRRSAFVTEAMAEKLHREKLRRLATKAAGSLMTGPSPTAWNTSAGTATWVDALRQENEERETEAHNR
jgi:hypothetical protein